jgi:hypothetical protein
MAQWSGGVVWTLIVSSYLSEAKWESNSSPKEVNFHPRWEGWGEGGQNWDFASCRRSFLKAKQCKLTTYRNRSADVTQPKHKRELGFCKFYKIQHVPRQRRCKKALAPCHPSPPASSPKASDCPQNLQSIPLWCLSKYSPKLWRYSTLTPTLDKREAYCGWCLTYTFIILNGIQVYSKFNSSLTLLPPTQYSYSRTELVYKSKKQNNLVTLWDFSCPAFREGLVTFWEGSSV